MPKKAEKKETTQVKSDELVVKEVAEKKSSKKATKPKKETKLKDMSIWVFFTLPQPQYNSSLNCHVF